VFLPQVGPDHVRVGLDLARAAHGDRFTEVDRKHLVGQVHDHPHFVTPHAGEFERLTGGPAGPRPAQALAQKSGAVVLLKGSPTFVMGEERWVVTSGGSELASIGTGDVLTGMIAAAMARGLGSEAAARAAAHLHGRAGASLAPVTTVTATRLLAEIGRFG
jgi:NAD(P)H-hydrate repair Nnr-like enzyme with NAD(P)H-hydrate dehydratase domain